MTSSGNGKQSAFLWLWLWLAPIVVGPVGLVGLVGSCARDAGALAPFPCATDGTCPDPLACIVGLCAPHENCDVVKQDCFSADRNRCTVVVWNGDRRTECVPSTDGPYGDGGRCPNADTGRDGCRIGSYCATWAGSGGQGLCARLCHTNADCSVDDTCNHFSGSASDDGRCR